MLLAEELFSKKVLIWLIVLSLVINLWLAVVKRFDPDEFTYFHISWYVAYGYLPYIDFFEHHQPLFGYLFGVFFKIFGNQIWLLYLGRFLGWLVLVGVVALVYKLGKKLYSQVAGLLGALILSTTLIFYTYS